MKPVECRNCQSWRTKRSGWCRLDFFLALLLLHPFRCNDCKRRFYRPAAEGWSLMPRGPASVQDELVVNHGHAEQHVEPPVQRRVEIEPVRASAYPSQRRSGSGRLGNRPGESVNPARNHRSPLSRSDATVRAGQKVTVHHCAGPSSAVSLIQPVRHNGAEEAAADQVISHWVTSHTSQLSPCWLHSAVRGRRAPDISRRPTPELQALDDDGPGDRRKTIEESD